MSVPPSTSTTDRRRPRRPADRARAPARPASAAERPPDAPVDSPPPGEQPGPPAAPATTEGPATATTAGSPPRGRRAPRGPRPASTPPRLVDTAGPDPGTPPEAVRLTIGTVLGAFGVAGELKVRLATDDPEHLPRLERVFLGDEPRPRRLLGVRFHAGQALLRLQGIATREQAAARRGEPVRIAGADARPLAEGEFFLYQLVGLDVVDEAGATLGRVTDLLETGANDVLVVTPDAGPDLLLPNHPSVVLDIRPAEGRLVARRLVFYGEEPPAAPAAAIEDGGPS